MLYETDCPLCVVHNEQILYQTPHLRVIAVKNELHAPAVCRVIWHAHISEMTDLLERERDEIMNVVYRVEQAMRQVLQPTKINLASLGNQVPHLHWHVIARFYDDDCFPAPIWANPVRDGKIILPKDWTESIKQILQG